MRALLLLILGLIVGAAGAGMVGNAIRLRHAYTRGVMDVMQHHAAALHAAARSGQCLAATTRQHLQVMSTMAGEIGPAFGNAGDTHFSDLAQQLKDQLSAADQVASNECKALAVSVQKIGERCDACHREYR